MSEFLDRFASEEACLSYLEKLRWPNGYVCSACGVAEEPYRSSRARLMCRSCAHQGSVTAGTIFDKTRTPLRVKVRCGRTCVEARLVDDCPH